MILKLLFTFLFVKGGLLLFDHTYKIPPKKTAKALERAVVRKKSIKDTFADSILSPIKHALVPLIRLSEEKELKLKYNLSRAGIEETPKEYYAGALTYALLALSVPLFLIIIGMNSLIPFDVLLVPLIFVSKTMEYQKVLEMKKDQIERCLPHFIRAILYKLNDRSEGSVKADLISIFEDYLKIAPEVFVYDISVMIMEMKSKDIETALRNFNSRLGIPEVSFLTNILIGITRGEHQNEALASLAREMDVKTKENMRRELDKRPGRVAFACIPLFIVSFFAIGYVLVMALLGSTANLI